MKIKQSWTARSITVIWLGFSLAAFGEVYPFNWRFWAITVPTVALYHWFAYSKADEEVKRNF